MTFRRSLSRFCRWSFSLTAIVRGGILAIRILRCPRNRVNSTRLAGSGIATDYIEPGSPGRTHSASRLTAGFVTSSSTVRSSRRSWKPECSSRSTACTTTATECTAHLDIGRRRNSQSISSTAGDERLQLRKRQNQRRPRKRPDINRLSFNLVQKRGAGHALCRAS